MEEFFSDYLYVKWERDDRNGNDDLYLESSDKNFAFSFTKGYFPSEFYLTYSGVCYSIKDIFLCTEGFCYNDVHSYKDPNPCWCNFKKEVLNLKKNDEPVSLKLTLNRVDDDYTYNEFEEEIYLVLKGYPEYKKKKKDTWIHIEATFTSSLIPETESTNDIIPEIELTNDLNISSDRVGREKQIYDNITSITCFSLKYINENNNIILGSNHYPYSARFSVDLNFDKLPKEFWMTYESNVYKITGLICPESGCNYANPHMCWCDLISEIDRTKYYEETFDFKTIAGGGSDDFYLIIKAQLIDDDEIEIDFSFRHKPRQNLISADYYLLTFFYLENPDFKLKIMKDHPFQFDIDRDDFPEEISILKQGYYFNTRNILCKKNCPTDLPCWCLVFSLLEKTDQLSENGIFIRFPLYIKNVNQCNNYLVLNIINDPNNKIWHCTCVITPSYRGAKSDLEIWCPDPELRKDPKAKYIYFDTDKL